MELITSEKEFLDTVDYLKNCGKSVGRFAFNGTLHDGHKHILEKIRPECDILVADLVHYMRFHPATDENAWSNPDINLVKEQLKEGPKVDFFIFNNFVDNIHEKRVFIKENFLQKFVSYGESINLNRDLILHAAGLELTSAVDYVSTSYIGPKNAVVVLLAEKIFERKLSWNWKIIWSCYRTDGYIAVSRTRGSIVLSKIALKAVEQIKNGVIDVSLFEKLMYDYYLENPKITVLDLKTLERINTLSDNCVLIFMDSRKSDFVFIKEGELIF